MTARSAGTRPGLGKPVRYELDRQVGFLLRQVSQRHGTIFAEGIGSDLTPTQWAALAKLHEIGPCSQNLLGRLTAMDGATVTHVDGVSVDFDLWHFNVRSSNTEPLLRLCLESLISHEDMEARRDELLGVIRG